MKIKLIIGYVVAAILLQLLLPACTSKVRKKMPDDFTYQRFKDSIKASPYDSAQDLSNVFDSTIFTPGQDSAEALFADIDTAWHKELTMLENMDTLLRIWKKGDRYQKEDLASIRENVQLLDSFLAKKILIDSSTCRGKNCLLYAEVILQSQTMYLYLDGILIDSFAVSTGVKKRETPLMSVRPSGPIFTRYTSKKFPGGNYNGLGNMPYAVFIRGGYAIHGTTPGNFNKLGTPASHGCIRLHPVNARIFYELVKLTGLADTWVEVKDSLP